MSREKQTIVLFMMGILFAVSVLASAAQMGTAFTYQGRLTDAGNPASGSYDLVFRLYDASSGGSQLGTQTKNGTAVHDGYFTVELDFGSSAFTGEARWLEIDVAPVDSGSSTTLEPRQEITPAPYALYAKSSGDLAVPVELSGSSASPILKATNNGTGTGLFGKATDELGIGVYGEAWGMNGVGVYANAPDLGNGANMGVYARAQGYSGRGVYGYVTGSAAVGVYGFAQSASGPNIGVRGVTNSLEGYGGYFEGRARVTDNLIVDANVGIGIENPTGTLHVEGGQAAEATDGSAITLKAQDGGDAPLLGGKAGHGGNIILLPGEAGAASGPSLPGKPGKVGIGTSSPQAKLHVSGGKTILEQESWQSPVLQNGWYLDPLYSHFNPAGYFKDSMGVVHLRGLIKGGTMSQAIFTLPAGYRPEYREMHVTLTYNNVAGRVDVYTTGEVVLEVGSTNWVSLDGITFRAAN